MVRSPFSGILKGKGLYSNSIRENGKKRTSFIVGSAVFETAEKFHPHWSLNTGQCSEWTGPEQSNCSQNCSFGTLTAQQGAVIAPRQRAAYRSAGISSACRAKTMS